METNPSKVKASKVTDLMNAVFTSEDSSIVSAFDAAKLVEQMNYAMRIPGDAPVLTDEESKLYRVNCQIIRHTRVALVYRNHALLQVYECRQWREQYRSVVEFARGEANLSKSQLYKALDEARVVETFAREKLVNCMPTGRYVELLVRLPANHWIAAWTLILGESDENGLSLVKRETFSGTIAGTENCHLREGSRMDTAKIRRFPRSCSHPPRRRTKIQGQKEAGGKNLSSEEEKAVCSLLSASLLKTLETAFKKPPTEIILDTLTEAGSSPQFTEDEFQGLSLVLSLLREHDEPGAELVCRQRGHVSQPSSMALSRTDERDSLQREELVGTPNLHGNLRLRTGKWPSDDGKRGRGCAALSRYKRRPRRSRSEAGSLGRYGKQ